VASFQDILSGEASHQDWFSAQKSRIISQPLNEEAYYVKWHFV